MEPNTAISHRSRRRHVVSQSFAGTPSLIGVAPLALSVNNEKARIKVALDKMSYLKSGWDGMDALPIPKRILSNVTMLLFASDDFDWKGWSIEPNINGSIILRSETRLSGISLGAESFSYYVRKGKNIEGEDNVDFTPEAVLSVMHAIR